MFLNSIDPVLYHTTIQSPSYLSGRVKGYHCLYQRAFSSVNLRGLIYFLSNLNHLLLRFVTGLFCCLNVGNGRRDLRHGSCSFSAEDKCLQCDSTCKTCENTSSNCTSCHSDDYREVQNGTCVCVKGY